MLFPLCSLTVLLFELGRKQNTAEKLQYDKNPNIHSLTDDAMVSLCFLLIEQEDRIYTFS